MAMRSSGKLAVLLLLLTLVVIAFIDLTREKQVDWSRSYDQRDKIPFGLYFTRTELPKLLGDRASVADFKSTNYSSLKTFLVGKEKSTVLYVVDQFYEGKESIAELLAFVERGGELFISSNSFPATLLDTLGVRQSYYYPQDFGEAIDVTERPFSLNNGAKAFYKDLDNPGLFYDIDSSGISRIGSFQAAKTALPNFLEVKWKKGRLLLHLEPLMFTNYYMLKKPNFSYGASALHLISREQVYWYDAFAQTNKQARTPLRVLLQNAGLREAWYLLLFGLLLFLLFRSKREQRAVPLLHPEKNLSKEFAKTIASLYFENGRPGNLVNKKIEYFLYDLRTKYLIDTFSLAEVGFAKQLSQKTSVPLLDCEQLIASLIRYKNVMYATDKELLEINTQIEEFKNKANIL